MVHPQGLARIVYHPQLIMGFPGLRLLHPFDGYRPWRVMQALEKEFGPGQWGEARPQGPLDDEQLARVHTREYLASLKHSLVLARAFEVWPFALTPRRLLDWIAVTPMRWACSAALLGARLALQQGVAISLGGGHHHAKPDRGEGFCILADVGYLVRVLQDEGKLQTVLYVDLDAHQGNGISHLFADDPRVQLFDMYNSEIYPYDDELGRSRLDVDLPLPLGTEDAAYLETLSLHLPGFLDRGGDLVIYNAGTDVLASDPLGGMELSPEGVLQRDMLVFAECHKRGLPILSLPSGGYSAGSAKAMAASAIHVLRRYGVSGS